MFTFADVSSHNTVTNWPAFLGSVDGCIVKATQGSTYVWPGASAALAAIRGAGKPTGAYAFAGDLGSDGKVRCGDPVVEADYFLAHYDWRIGEVPVLDFEPSIMPADPDGWCAAWLSRVKSRIGVVPWIYMSSFVARSSTWAKTRATGARLWVAQYGVNNGQPGPLPAVGSWPGYVAWQFTSMGARPGVTSPPLDLSTFSGDVAAWKAYGTHPTTEDFMATMSDAEKAALMELVGVFLPGRTGRAAGPGWIRLDNTANAVTQMSAAVAELLAKPGVSAADIAAAIPDTLAQAVIDALGKRITTPPAA